MSPLSHRAVAGVLALGQVRPRPHRAGTPELPPVAPVGRSKAIVIGARACVLPALGRHAAASLIAPARVNVVRCSGVSLHMRRRMLEEV